MKRLEDKILWICFIIFIAYVIAMMLIGCTTQRATDADIIYHQGGCLFVVEGLTVEQVKQATKDWAFDTECRISVRTTID